MNKIFSNLNQTGNLLNDMFGQDVRILEDGQAFFRTLMIEDQIDITGSKLINVGTPTDSTDAANKFYVDTVAAGIGPIDGSRLIDNTVGLSKLSVISANTIIANNTGVSSTPIALGVSDIKTMLSLTGTNSGDQEIKLQGDVSGMGYGTFTTTINSNAVTLGKMAQLAPNTIIGNNTGSNFTPAALSISDVKTMLSLSNSNSGDQTITLTGDVTGSGMGSFAATIADNAITTAKIANNNVTLGKIATISTGTILGNKELGSNSPAALSISQVKTMLDLSNTNTGDQTIVLSGSISGSGTGAISTTLADNAVTNTKLAVKSVSLDKIVNISANTILGNNISGNQSPAALSISDVKTMLNLAGNNTGDQTIILNGIISGSGSSTITTTLADNSVGLGKLGTLTPLSIIGNNLGISATPDALSVAEVKAMLDLNGVNSGDQNITLSGDVIGSGTTEIITTINNGKITLAKMANLAANSIIGNNTASATVPKALTTAEVRSLLSINNVENSALSTYNGNVGNITINSGGIGTELSLNGSNTGNTRAILWKNNGTKRMEMGITSEYFFIYDSVLLRDIYRYTFSGSTPLRFPIFSTLGTLQIVDTGGSVNNTSDRRLKQNEEVLNSAISLQQILNLQPKKYTWKSDTDNRTRIGFIAQDVQIAIPEAVDGKKFEYEFVRDSASQGNEGDILLDEEGKPVLDYEKPRYRGLDQCAILSTLVSAVQELAKKNNLLEERLAVLESYDYIEA